MAATPIPKKPKDPESDKLQRVQAKHLRKIKADVDDRKQKIDFLKKEGRIDELNDYIFGRSSINPLDGIKS